MNFLHHLQQAFVNIQAAKMRSFLAVLGILVGSAAIVALLSCGQLATEQALAQFKALGTDLLSVSIYQKMPGKISVKADTLSAAQWQQLAVQIPAIRKIAAYSTAFQPLSFQGKILKGAVISADEQLASVLHLDLSEGHFVSFVESFEHYCVLGHNIAMQMQKTTQDPLLGKQIRIGKALYTVIGIARPWMENNFFNEHLDNAVIIPLKGMSLVSQESSIHDAILLINPDADTNVINQQLSRIIENQVPKMGVFIRSPRQVIASMESQGRIFTLLLAVIGSISLLVGGIGIMNIMLVSVSERKKEIGLRKAVGAKNKDIQRLFLMESLLLSLFGGGLGVLSGLLLTWCIACFSHWAFMIYWLPIAGGFAVSVASGVFFGFYPAKRASRLEPVASLRSE